MYRYPITIASGNATSSELDLTLDHQCIVGLEIPAEITATSFKLQGKGGDGEWKDVWLAKTPPSAARVGVIRSDFQEPLWAVARFSSYSAGQNLWNKMPEVMIGKCAESLALRKAFPQELGDLYSPEEMDQAEPVAPYNPPTPTATVTATIIESAPRPWKTFKEMLALFSELKEKSPEDLYYKVLKSHGVAHANEFKDANSAVNCYRELSAIVARMIEAPVEVAAE